MREACGILKTDEKKKKKNTATECRSCSRGKTSIFVKIEGQQRKDILDEETSSKLVPFVNEARPCKYEES